MSTKATALYDDDGQYFYPPSFVAAHTEELYSLDPRGRSGDVDLALNAGKLWPVGALVAGNYMAGDANAQAVAAAWVSGSSVSVEITQTLPAAVICRRIYVHLAAARKARKAWLARQ